MSERLEKLERAVDALEKAVSRQDRRLAALEGRGAEIDSISGGDAESTGQPEPAPEPLSGQLSLAALKGTPTLVGRSLLILAGAFLLRALTEAATLATATGVILGLLYAASWIVMAAVAAGRGARVSAGFYGVCAALIAYPLIFEATTEFGVLSTTASVTILVLVTAAGLVMAFRWRLQESAWVFSLGAMLTASTLAVVRPPGETETAVLVALGLAAVWLASARGWESLRWLTAVTALVGVLRLTAMGSAPDGMPEGFGPFHLPFIAFLQAAVLLGYVGSSFVRAVRGRLQLRLFDFVQTAAAWAVGWGGAVQLARANDVGTGWLAVCAFVVGLAAYGEPLVWSIGARGTTGLSCISRLSGSGWCCSACRGSPVGRRPLSGR